MKGWDEWTSGQVSHSVQSPRVTGIGKYLGSLGLQRIDCVVSGFRFLQEADRPYVHTKFLLGPSYVHRCNVNDGQA